MIPLRDANPGRSTPFVSWAVMATAIYVFFAVQPVDLGASERFFYQQASIPCEVVTGEPLSMEEIRSGTCRVGGAPVFPDKNVWWSLLVSIFLHGGLGHLLGNMWVLWIFGNNVEDAYGHLGYALLYLGSGLAASLGHVALNADSTIPVVGASGAIAGVMGAYLVLYPTARVLSIIPPFFFLPFGVPAAVFLVLWLVGQFALAGSTTPIAWAAHVIGFLTGLLVTMVGRARLLRHARRVRY